ncbi:MAG: YcxB family protein, partial [Bdellovibrionales bacterium]|nr:YcxB family protein [Bdellovibrionales bacterium]
RKQCNSRWWKLVNFCLVLLLLDVLFKLLSKSTHGSAEIGYMSAWIFVGVYWIFLRWPLTKFLILRRFRAAAERNHTLDWEVSDEGLFARCGDLSEGRFRWEAISSVCETPDGFLLYRGVIYHWLPREAFTQQQLSDFLTLLHAKLKNVTSFGIKRP